MIICPHCEKPTSEHDKGACNRKKSRRWFLGAMGGVVAAAVLPKRIPTGGLLDPKIDIAAQWERSRICLDAFASRYIEPTARDLAARIDIASMESITVVEHWWKRPDGVYRSIDGAPFEKTPFLALPFVKYPAGVREPW